MGVYGPRTSTQPTYVTFVGFHPDQSVHVPVMFSFSLTTRLSYEFFVTHPEPRICRIFLDE